MAILLFDGFDHYDWSQRSRKWIHENSTGSHNLTGGRFGNGCLYGSNSITNGQFRGHVTTTSTTAIFGMAYKCSAFSVNPLFRCYTPDGVTCQWSLYDDASGHLRVMRGDGVTDLAISTSTLSTNTWYYIEVKVLIADGTGGTADVQVNGSGTGWIAATSLDTRQSTTTDQWGYFIVAGSGGHTHDDLYVADGATGFLGDVRVVTLWPAGEGSNSEWTCATGTSHSGLVDELISTDDAALDYLYASAAVKTDTFDYGNLATGTVKAIQHCVTARKTEPGARSIAPVTRISSTDYAGTTKYIGTDFAIVREIAETKPTGGAWSVSDVNGAQFGFKLVS